MERPREVVVVDSSVVVKWFIEEEYSNDALKLRDDYVARKVDIAVPELLPYEVLNSLRYNPNFGLKELKSIGQALEEYDFWTFPLRGELIESAIEIAVRSGITIYDASYVSLSQLRSWVAYTADSKLIEKVKDETPTKHVSDYRSA